MLAAEVNEPSELVALIKETISSTFAKDCVVTKELLTVISVIPLFLTNAAICFENSSISTPEAETVLIIFSYISYNHKNL